ncbi:4-hydroxyphenylacetate 3-hydroxylase family protein [Bordetella sp. 2513F-2]
MTKSIKNGQSHIDSLRDARTVFINGELAGDVTEHAAFRNAVRSSASLYDYQAAPENADIMTFETETGHRVNRAWQAPRNHAEMVGRRKALVNWAELHGGFMGRSPDHVASALLGQHMGLNVFAQYNAERAAAFDAYFRNARDQDLFLTYVIINPQSDRSKSWGEQQQDLVAAVVDENAEGITIRGAKMLGTSSIMANEVFVANLQPLQKGEEKLAFSCAIPMGTPGLKVLSRKSFEQHAVSEFDNPLSHRFDENDALMYFDDVKVPWERVFTYNNTDACRAQFHDTPGHTMQNYQAQIRLSVKMRFLVGIARKITEAIGTIALPPVREKLGWLSAQVGMVEGMLYGMEANGTQYNDYFVPDRAIMYSAQVVTQELYAKVINLLRELAGGALIMLPSSVKDLENPELLPILAKTQVSAALTPEERVLFLKLAWDAIGSEFASRHQQYEMFYAGAQFVTCGHSFRTFNWDRATEISNTLLSNFSHPLKQEEIKCAA